MQLLTKDGNKKVRTLDINGFVKPTGTIVASVTNDKNDTYFVQVRTNGTSACEHMVNGKREKCQGHKYTGHCYHTDAVKALAFPTFSQVARDEPACEGKYAERLQEWTLHNAQDAYTILAATKKPVHGWGCCGHIVKSEHDGQLCGACMCK